jgi:hypothetical protein
LCIDDMHSPIYQSNIEVNMQALSHV